MIIAEQAAVLPGSPLRWVSGVDRHLHELGEDAARPIDLGPASELKGPVWDDRYWYRARCYEHCDGHTSMGSPAAVERVDRQTGETLRLGRGDYGLGNILPYGDHVYWGVYGHQIEGGVRRVPKSGGAQETVWSLDKVEDLDAYPDGILVTGASSVAWIPAAGGPVRTFFRGETGGAAVDDENFYIAEYGDPYWESKDSGYIHKVPRDRRGTPVKLAGPIRWPTAIAAHGDHVYFMLSESDAVWSVSKAGGTPTVAVPAIATANGGETCDESLRMWADARGLFWTRGQRFFGNGATLYFVSWAALGR